MNHRYLRADISGGEITTVGMVKTLVSAVALRDEIPRHQGQQINQLPLQDLAISGSSAAEVVNVLIEDIYAMVVMTVMTEVMKTGLDVQDRISRHQGNQPTQRRAQPIQRGDQPTHHGIVVTRSFSAEVMADVFPEAGCAMVIMTVMMEVMKTGIDVQD